MLRLTELPERRKVERQRLLSALLSGYSQLFVVAQTILLFHPLPLTPFLNPGVWGPGMFCVLYRCGLQHEKYNG